jgi:hypothetical protein
MRPVIRLAGATIIGRSHEKEHWHCQDAVACWKGSDKVSACIALSDGAGSKPHSLVGANLAVNSMPSFFKGTAFDLFHEDTSRLKNELVSYLRDRLCKTAAVKTLNYSDLAATLLFVFVVRKRSSTRYIAGHVGDGVIVCDRCNGIEVISHPDTGEYANATTFVTSDDMESRLRIYSGVISGKTGFMLMSDGAAETLYIRRQKASNLRYCRQMFDWCDKYPRRKIEKILMMNLKRGVFRDVTRDDCSIAMLRVIS